MVGGGPRFLNILLENIFIINFKAKCSFNEHHVIMNKNEMGTSQIKFTASFTSHCLSRKAENLETYAGEN